MPIESLFICIGQLRWLGPEKGIIHLAVGVLINSLWDLYAKLMNVPLWKLLVTMSPEQLVKCINFQWITDVLTKEEALEMLKAQVNNMMHYFS